MEFLGQDRREGLGRRADSRAALVTLFIVSILMLLSSLYSAEASVFRKARETVIDAAAPALAMFAGPINYIQNRIGDVRDYFNVLEQNEALREENAELRQWMNEALEMRQTIAEFERLNAYKAPPPIAPINAFVIGESNDAFSHSMLVNVGSTDGARNGQAVVDGLGLVGRIVDVGRGASRILLLTDVQSRVPVYVEGADIEGILVGRTKAQPSISFTESSDPVVFEVGQRVLTSGAGGVMPRGIPVGEVVADIDGEAVVDLYANYARTRLVRLINYQFPAVEPETAPAAPDGEAAEADAQADAQTPAPNPGATNETSAPETQAEAAPAPAVDVAEAVEAEAAFADEPPAGD